MYPMTIVLTIVLIRTSKNFSYIPSTIEMQVSDYGISALFND